MCEAHGKIGGKKTKTNISKFLEHLQIFSLCQDLVMGQTIYMDKTFLKILP